MGLVPEVLTEWAPSAAEASALVCGPPVMLKFTLAALEKLDFAPGNVYTTLEARMKCGVGKCGHCNIGPFRVCRDGPVLSAAEPAALPEEV